MAKRLIGKVGGLWRFPVKSMLGEKLDQVNVTIHGVAGDRAWALREVANGKVVSAKKFPKMFEMRSAYERSPDDGDLPPVRITLPDGKTIHAADENASEILSSILGTKMHLERPQAGQTNLAGIDPRTVFGDVGIEKIYPALTASNAPDFFPLPEGTFFDSGLIHVVASATLEHARRLAGSNSRFDPRRFRCNIFVESEGEPDGFVEDGWLGGMLEIGESVKITGMQGALRCVMTTHPQDDLERDPVILRTVAKAHEANLGVFASVGARGRVEVGDAVYLVK
jgi:uncharacterized protein